MKQTSSQDIQGVCYIRHRQGGGLAGIHRGSLGEQSGMGGRVTLQPFLNAPFFNQRATLELEPKESLAVLLSLTQGKPCHPSESEALVSLTRPCSCQQYRLTGDFICAPHSGI